MLKPPLALSLTIDRTNMSLPPNLVLVNHQPFQTDRTARVDLVGTDTDLGAETITHAVREASRRVPVRAGSVHGRHEALGLVLVGSQDRLGVVRAVRVDVVDGGRQVGDGLDGEGEGEEFGVVVGVNGVDNGDVARGRRKGGLGDGVATELDALGGQSGGDGGEDGAESGFLDQEGLDAVAGGRVAGLGIDDDVGGQLGVGGGGQVDGAQAVGVAEDGDLGVLLDVAHQLVGAAGDDEVDVAVEGEQLRDGLARGDELDGGIGDLGLGQGVGDDGADDHEGFRRLLAALEDGRVAGLNGQSGDVGDYFGTSLEDDEQHADGAGHALQLEIVVQLGTKSDPADGILKVAHVQDALEHVLPLARLAQVEARHQAGAQLAVSGGLAGQLKVAGIGGQDVVARGSQAGVDGCQGVVAGLGRERGQHVGGRLGRPSRIGGTCVGERHFCARFLV